MCSNGQTHLFWFPAFVPQNQETKEQIILQMLNCMNPSCFYAVDVVQHYSAVQI